MFIARLDQYDYKAGPKHNAQTQMNFISWSQFIVSGNLDFLHFFQRLLGTSCGVTFSSLSFSLRCYHCLCIWKINTFQSSKKDTLQNSHDVKSDVFLNHIPQKITKLHYNINCWKCVWTFHTAKPWHMRSS